MTPLGGASNSVAPASTTEPRHPAADDPIYRAVRRSMPNAAPSVWTDLAARIADELEAPSDEQRAAIAAAARLATDPPGDLDHHDEDLHGAPPPHVPSRRP